MIDKFPSLDPNVNQRKAADPKSSVWVAASAGSGKTKVLSDRVLNLLLNGAKPEKILCLTFTKAAATQMSNRIANRLSQWAVISDEELIVQLKELQEKQIDDSQIRKARRLFAEVLDASGGMKILTIHSFCQQILKRFPLEAGVAPNFEVMDERSSKLVLDNVLQASIRSSVLQDDVETISEYMEEKIFEENFQKIYSERGKIQTLIKSLGSIEKVIDILYQTIGIDPKLTLEKVNQSIINVNQNIKTAADILLEGGVKDKARADKIYTFLQADEKKREKLIEEYILVFLTKKGQICKQLTTKSTAKAAEIMETEAERIFDLNQKRKLIVVAKINATLIRICIFILQEYEKRKACLGFLDYSDLILKTLNLLEKVNGAAWVLYKLDGGIDHILVDEAQDTSPEQWAIVRALAAEFFAGEGARTLKRTIFAVGDKKQSIFSFQGADPLEFAENKKYFQNKLLDIGEKLEEIPLEISFRSSEAILNLVNLILENPKARKGVLDENEQLKHFPYRKNSAGRVEVWEPVVTEKNDQTSIPWSPPLERVFKDSPQSRLANLIANRIAKMINEKEMLISEARPIKPADIMVLVRKRNIFFEELVRALKTLKIPVTGLDRMILSEQMPVMDLIALGDFLLLPEDDLNLAQLLKSPLFNFDDDDLFSIAYDRKDKSLWENLREQAEQKKEKKYQNTVETLLILLDKVDNVTPFTLYSIAVDAMGGRKALLSRLGYEAEDALDEFMNLTLIFSKTNTPSLQNFLSWIKKSDIKIKRDLEQENVNAVRITTVHSSKGLEAPIIFLPDTFSKISKKNHLSWITNKQNLKIPLWLPNDELIPETLEIWKEKEKEKALSESRRLLYVALTRPRDRIYICGWLNKNETKAKDEKQNQKEQKEETWYDLILDALNTNEAKEILKVEYHKNIGKVLVIESKQTNLPLKQINTNKEKTIEIPSWVLQKPKEEPMPPRPLSPSRLLNENEEISAPSPITPKREIALLRGKVIHRLLQILPEINKDKRMQIAQKYLTEPAFKFSEIEQKNILQKVFNLLLNPTLAPLFSEKSKAEVPIVGLLDDKVFSGQVDRLVETQNEIIIIDYKTNQKPPDNTQKIPEQYLRQMKVYKQMLQKIFPEKNIRGLLLWTENMSLTEI